MSRVVLAEKPSVALDLARVVDAGAKRREGYLEGNRYTWTWAVGHLVELAPPEAYAPALEGRWRLELLPVVPERFRLRPREGRTEQLRVVERLLAQASEVVVATDAGREGELIWEYVREACGYAGPARRLWLAETTPAAVRAAFAALLPDGAKADLGRAARARSEADWLVGMNATMALSARHGGLWSAGRVQTPTLALLVRREAEIRAFDAQEYFVVTARFRSGDARYAGRWFRGERDRFGTAAEAEAVAAKVRGRRGRVAAAERRRAQEQPPRLFNLTDLQRAANTRFGLSAAAALKAAQSLYETHKLLTYPRTDARHVSGDTFRTFPARLRAVAACAPALGADLAAAVRTLCDRLTPPGRRVVDDAQVGDHHALLPTDRVPDPARLSADERRVYELVARRFAAALLPAAAWDEAEVVTEVSGETFRSRSRSLAVPGWRAAEPPARERGAGAGGKGRAAAAGDGVEEGDEDDAMAAEAGGLEGLAAGDPADCLRAEAAARRTKPPARYTEASLLRAMEHAGRLVDDEALAEAMRQRGLGTPATRAAIIETLIKRGYATREKRSLVPTPKGERLVGLAPEPLLSVETTGEWERRLRLIESGQAAPGAFLSGIAALTRDVVAAVGRQARVAAAPAGRPSLGRCPNCGGEVVEGKKAFGCINWRPEHGGCRWCVWKTVAGKALTANQAKELLAHGETRRVLKGFTSRAGRKFDARLRLDRETGRVEFVFEEGGTRAGAQARAGADGGSGAGTRAPAGGDGGSGAGTRARAGARAGSGPGVARGRAAGDTAAGTGVTAKGRRRAAGAPAAGTGVTAKGRRRAAGDTAAGTGVTAKGRGRAAGDTAAGTGVTAKGRRRAAAPRDGAGVEPEAAPRVPGRPASTASGSRTRAAARAGADVESALARRSAPR